MSLDFVKCHNRAGIECTSSMQSLRILSLRAHTEISSSIRFCLFVMVFFFISDSNIPHGQRSISISCTARNWVTDLPLWHGAPSCMNMSSPVPEKLLLGLLGHLFSWGSSRFSNIVFYWSWFLLPLTIVMICIRPVTKTLITLHTMTWMGCFTLCLHADAYELLRSLDFTDTVKEFELAKTRKTAIWRLVT